MCPQTTTALTRRESAITDNEENWTINTDLESVPIRFALTDLPAVSQVADSLGISQPWSSADLADVMTVVLAGYDKVRLDDAKREADGKAAVMHRDGTLATMLDMHAQGTRIADVIAAFDLTPVEWLAAFAWTPLRNTTRWERHRTPDDMFEFEARALAGESVSQLSSRFEVHRRSIAATVNRLGLGGEVFRRKNVWSAAADKAFAEWAQQGLSLAEIRSRLHRQFNIDLTREALSKKRVGLIGRVERRVLSDDEVDDLIRRNQAGERWSDLAAQIGLSVQTIRASVRNRRGDEAA